jgi:quinol monooxygenase YgiN
VPERRGEFLELLEGVLDAMRNEPMFHEAILHRASTSENHFMLYETWESHEDVLDVQLHRSYRQAWHGALPRVLAGARHRSGSQCVPIASTIAEEMPKR